MKSTTYVIEYGLVGPDPEWTPLCWDACRELAVEEMGAIARSSPVPGQYGPTGYSRLRVREVTS